MIIQNSQIHLDFNSQFNLQFDLESFHDTTPLPDGSTNKQLSFQFIDQNISLYTNIGNRSQNLDQFDYYQTHTYQLFGIYDGHGDSTVSNYLKIHLIKNIIHHPLFFSNFTTAVYQTFKSIEQKILAMQQNSDINSGAVAIIVLIRENLIYTVNLGDCKAFMVDNSYNCKALNKQHNLNEQEQYFNVKQKGGIIIKRRNNFRLNGQLNISRSFGDKKHKKFMSSVPDISVNTIRGFKYLLIGSDGFWNQISCSKLVQGLCNCNINLNKAKYLCNIGNKGKDNCTLFCIQLMN